MTLDAIAIDGDRSLIRRKRCIVIVPKAIGIGERKLSFERSRLTLQRDFEFFESTSRALPYEKCTRPADMRQRRIAVVAFKRAASTTRPMVIPFGERDPRDCIERLERLSREASGSLEDATRPLVLSRDPKRLAVRALCGSVARIALRSFAQGFELGTGEG